MSDSPEQKPKKTRSKSKKSTTPGKSHKRRSWQGEAEQRTRRHRRSRKMDGVPDLESGLATGETTQGEKSRTKLAKKAFASGDAEASKALHAARSVTEEAGHKSGGEYLKSMTYGAMDGLITTFAVVSAVVGGDLALSTVLVMGFANMLADGISMGLGDYLSSSAELKFAKMERARELWECENDLAAEKAEMVELYSLKDGISEEEAVQIVDIISKNNETFVDIMMVEELGLMPPDEDDSPLKNGFITFGAFVVFGTVPLLPYVVAAIAADDNTVTAKPDGVFATAVALTAIMMFTLGALTSRFTADDWYIAGLFTMFNGGLAALASYVIALLVAQLFDVEV